MSNRIESNTPTEQPSNLQNQNIEQQSIAECVAVNVGGLTSDDIQQIFDFSEVSSGSKLEKGLIELSQILSGKLLLKKIYDLRENLPNPQKIQISSQGTKCQFATDSRGLNSPLLTLPDAAFEDKYHPFLVKTPNNQLGIVMVAPPPAQVLAHELGHVLHFLEAGANSENEKLCARFRYNQIIGDIKTEADKLGYEVGNNIVRTGAGLFLSMWNHDNFTEIINILPEELMLPEGQFSIISVGNTEIKEDKKLPTIDKREFPTSDGIFLREITKKYGSLKICGQAGEEPALVENFTNEQVPAPIRFGHESARDLLDHIKGLRPAEQLKFGYLTNMLISKIRTSATSNERMTVNSLPVCQTPSLTFPFLLNFENATTEQAYEQCKQKYNALKNELQPHLDGCDVDLLDFATFINKKGNPYSCAAYLGSEAKTLVEQMLQLKSLVEGIKEIQQHPPT